MGHLAFILGNEAYADRLIKNSCLELGLRIGIPFRIVAQSTELPKNTTKIYYGNNITAKSGLVITCATGPSECIVSKQGNTLFGPVNTDGNVDYIAGASRLLNFEHEKDAPRDFLGRIDPADNPLVKLGLNDTPLLETMADQIYQDLINAGMSKTDRLRAFGTGKRAVCLTHDTDSPELYSLFQMARSLVLSIKRQDQRATFLAGLKGMLTKQDDPFWNFTKWADLIESKGGKSTVFVYPGQTAHSPRHSKDPRYNPMRRKYRKELSALVNRGIEVGIHHAINTDTVDGYRAASSQISDITGVKPTGCRAHYWRINWHNPHQSWQAMRDSGLDYDTSLSPLDLGYRNGTSLPVFGGHFNTGTAAKDALVVIPTSVMDWYAEPRDLGAVASAHKRVGGLFEHGSQYGLVVLNWHIRTLTNIGAWDRLGDLAKTLLSQLSEDPDTVFLTAAEVAQKWRHHASRLLCE